MPRATARPPFSPRAAAALALALALLPALAAGPSAMAGPSAPAAPVAQAIGYQGWLTDAAGQPLDGPHELRFRLWDAAEAGNPLGGELVRPGVMVAGGLFSTTIALPDGLPDGRALWLAVAVDGTWLAPRQALLAAPYALGLAGGARVVDEREDPVLSLENAGPGPALAATGAFTGLLASGLSGPGVQGESQLASGVFGRTSGGFASGVEGRGPTGVAGFGALVGVTGSSPADNGRGVLGIVEALSGTGVEGRASLGTGVAGIGEVGVTGTGSTGAGVEGSGPTGVAGFSSLGAGLFGQSTGGTDSAGVRGQNSGLGFGGEFRSDQAIGLFARGVEGVHGESSVGSHPGVHGTGPNVGVLGEGLTGPGLRGVSSQNDGVVGRSEANDKSGVYAYHPGSGHGLTARSEQGDSLFVPSAGQSGIHIGEVPVHGVHVDGAGGIGFDVAAASVGVQVYSTTKEGMLVHSAGMDGIRVASAAWSGLWIESAGVDALRVQSAGQDGLRIFDTVGRDYIRAGSNADADFRVAGDGLVLSDRGFRCGEGAPGCLQSGQADLAEQIDSLDALTAGDVVEIDPAAPDRFRLARGPRSRLVAGVVSADPAIMLGRRGLSTEDAGAADDRPALALVGRVPVKASAENGPIAIGDLLVSAGTPGHAMRDPDPALGTVLGKALEALEAGQGTILMLVQPR